MKSLFVLKTLVVVILFNLLANGKPGVAQIQTESQPLKKILNPDGTLNMEAVSNGSFNPEGYRMDYAENGKPIFVSSSIDVPSAINYVKTCFDAGFAAAKTGLNQVHTICYEQLVSDPKKETKKVRTLEETFSVDNPKTSSGNAIGRSIIAFTIFLPKKSIRARE